MLCPGRLNHPSRHGLGSTRGRRTIWSGTLRCGDRGSQPPTRSVQADPRRVARATKHRRDLPGAQPLPSLQGQDLPIAVSQRPKRGSKLRQLTRKGCGHVPAGQLAAQPLGELSAATLAATLVCQHATRDAEQPQTRVRSSRGIIEPTPSDEECFGNHVGSVVGAVGAPQDVAQHNSLMLSVQRLKAPTARVGGEVRQMGVVSHTTLRVHHSNKHFTRPKTRVEPPAESDQASDGWRSSARRAEDA